MNPLSLPGPEFLALWITGAIVVAGVALVARRAIAGPRPALEELDALAAGLHPTELGYLIGGIGRAVEAAVAGLVHSGALVITDGALRVVDTAPRLYGDGAYRGYVDEAGQARVERHVLATLRRTPGAPIAVVIQDAAGLDAELAERQRRAGLLVPESAGQRLRLRLPGMLWLGVGLAKLVVGVSRHRPVTALAVLLVFGVIALVKLVPPRRTARGEALARQQVERSRGLEATAQSAPDQLSGSDVALAYALFGAAAVGAAVAPLMPSYQAALASGSSSGGGCGSSCGGGCGGGCGGCS